MTVQRNACFQQFLAESKQSVTYRLHMLLYIKLIIVLERCKYIRQHPVDSATLIIAALMPWNSEPFMCSVLVSYNAAAVSTEDKTAFLTYGAKKFTAL